jgi:hypothetical protein
MGGVVRKNLSEGERRWELGGSERKRGWWEEVGKGGG